MFSTLSSPPPLCDGDGVSMRKTMFKRSSCFSLLGEEAGADLAPSVSAALVEAVAAAVVALGVESIAVPCAPPSSVGGLEAEAAALVAVAAVSPSSSSRLRFCPLVESLLRVLRVFFLLDIFLQAK
jgi:hypothetical protein